MTSQKLLIIRFSSFGDIVQCLSAPQCFRQSFKGSEVHWAVRADFASVLTACPEIQRIWSLDRKQGLRGLIGLARELAQQKYTHIYDAHSSLRSHFLCWLLWAFHWNQKRPQFTRRSKQRLKRFLLFKFRWNLFKKPYFARNSYVEPLRKWQVAVQPDQKLNWQLPMETKNSTEKLLPEVAGFVALVPSAAWPMKRWPLAHWTKLAQRLPEEYFVVLGGPDDAFCNEIEKVAPTRVKNLAGQLSWLESCAVVEKSKAVISADTGLLHMADQLGHPGIALLGPTAFGRPLSLSLRTEEVELPCRPCSKDGRGRCTQNVYQKCMVDITPDQVADNLQKIMEKKYG